MNCTENGKRSELELIALKMIVIWMELRSGSVDTLNEKRSRAVLELNHLVCTQVSRFYYSI